MLRTSIKDWPWPRALWALPLVLSLLFVLGVVGWAQKNQAADEEEQRRTLISDALSLEARLRDQVDAEAVQLNAVAAALDEVALGWACWARCPRWQRACAAVG